MDDHFKNNFLQEDGDGRQIPDNLSDIENEDFSSQEADSILKNLNGSGKDKTVKPEEQARKPPRTARNTS